PTPPTQPPNQPPFPTRRSSDLKCEQHDCLPQNHANNIPSTCTKGHSNTDLILAGHYDVRNHTIEPNHGQQSGQCTEKAREQSHHPFAYESILDILAKHAEVRPDFWIQLVDLRSECREHDRRWRGRAEKNGKPRAESWKL